jgi:hypothetical protein
MRFKRRTLFVVMTFAVLLASGARAWKSSVNGLPTLIWLCVLGEDTEWAADYTDEAFVSVTRGMTRAQVHEMLGEPLHTEETQGGAELVDRWTRSPSDSNFWQRAVVFRDDRVVKKLSDFCVDD